MKVLVLGANGMLGHAVFKVFNESLDIEVCGTVRSEAVKNYFSNSLSKNIYVYRDVENQDVLSKIFSDINPDVVINCIAVTREPAGILESTRSLAINALLPHRLATLCSLTNARLVHISTDGVFSGNKGGYVEDDISDVNDIYGISKLLGEVSHTHTITLRTSIIGHSLRSGGGLIDWFLAQKKQCKGFTKIIFSGYPTVVLAQIIRDVIILKPELFGLYHLATQPISKYDLLSHVAKIYGKSIDIVPIDEPAINRTLISERFHLATGYVAPEWPELIKTMYEYRN